MKSAFPGYFRPTDAEFSALWGSATFVVDANVLLGLYGYSPRTRKSVIELLESIRNRIWMPHQFASEFLKNRPKAILEQIKNYDDAIKSLKEVINNKFKSKKVHPFVSRKFLLQLDNLCEQLTRKRAKQLKMLTHDDLLMEVSKIFEGRIGLESPESRLQEIFAEGQARFAKGIPPGFADKNKPAPGCYGDLVGWMQIIEFGKENSKPIILVTDDRKNDWWLLRKDSTDIIGPHPELIREYRGKAQGDFYMYGFEQFMLHSAQYLGSKVGKQTLAEVREQSSSSVNESSGVLKSSSIPLKAIKHMPDVGNTPKVDAEDSPAPPKTEG